MKTKFNIKTAISTSVLFALSATATAGGMFPRPADKSEIDACVAAVNEAANLEDAERIRHDVESRERRTVGHKLIIDTTVYGTAGILREYHAVCVVEKGDAPTSFEMQEVDSRS